METIQETQEFYTFMKTHHPEMIEGWKKKFECPVCMEEKSGYKAVFCDNGHYACCATCSEKILAVKGTNAPCTICRKTEVITPTSDNAMIKKLEHRLQLERIATDRYKFLYQRYNERCSKNRAEVLKLQDQVQVLNTRLASLGANQFATQNVSLKVRDLNNPNGQPIDFETVVSGQKLYASKRDVFFFKKANSETGSDDYKFKFNKDLRSIRIGMRMTLNRKVDGQTRKYEFKVISM